MPALGGRVTDLAQLLMPEQRSALEAQLRAYEVETTHQIAVLTIPSLGGQTIEAFSLTTAREWRLGRAGYDNGILVTLAPAERGVRIELGRGLQRFVSNDDVRAIIDEAMLPSVRSGAYADGLQQGLGRLMEVARRYVVPP